jgi:hypothetical protein
LLIEHIIFILAPFEYIDKARKKHSKLDSVVSGAKPQLP